jgi:hypothetical protein
VPEKDFVPEEDEGTDCRLLNQHGVLPEEFAMVGSALRSDVAARD